MIPLIPDVDMAIHAIGELSGHDRSGKAGTDD
jgi:hypothetical protein